MAKDYPIVERLTNVSVLTMQHDEDMNMFQVRINQELHSVGNKLYKVTAAFAVPFKDKSNQLCVMINVIGDHFIGNLTPPIKSNRKATGRVRTRYSKKK